MVDSAVSGGCFGCVVYLLGVGLLVIAGSLLLGALGVFS